MNFIRLASWGEEEACGDVRGNANLEALSNIIHSNTNHGCVNIGFRDERDKLKRLARIS